MGYLDELFFTWKALLIQFSIFVPGESETDCLFLLGSTLTVSHYVAKQIRFFVRPYGYSLPSFRLVLDSLLRKPTFKSMH